MVEYAMVVATIAVALVLSFQVFGATLSHTVSTTLKTHSGDTE